MAVRIKKEARNEQTFITTEQVRQDTLQGHYLQIQ